MSSDIENNTGKTENVSIDPIYNTNWCDMPDDIKLECIGKMECKERLSLRCTAKAEKSLVDSQKIEFTQAHIWASEISLGCTLYSSNKLYYSNYKIPSFKFINYIKRVGVFETLKISSKNEFSNNEQFMADDGLFTVKNIEFNYCNIDNMIAIFRKMKDGVESIKMNLISRKISDTFDEILAISHVQNAPYWHIRDHNQTNILHKVAQMWIDRNSKIGSIFQLSTYKKGAFEEFRENFTDRIVSKSDKRARISTNNPDRHILLERGLDDVVRIDCHLKFFRMMVISAEKMESEYNDNCKEWICKIDPSVYYKVQSSDESE